MNCQQKNCKRNIYIYIYIQRHTTTRTLVLYIKHGTKLMIPKPGKDPIEFNYTDQSDH